MDQAELVIIGITAGLALGLLIAVLIYFVIRWYKKHTHPRRCSNEQSVTTLPIRINGLDASTDFSASISSSVANLGRENESHQKKNSPFSLWSSNQNKDWLTSASGIPRYPYK